MYWDYIQCIFGLPIHNFSQKTPICILLMWVLYRRRFSFWYLSDFGDPSPQYTMKNQPGLYMQWTSCFKLEGKNARLGEVLDKFFVHKMHLNLMMKPYWYKFLREEMFPKKSLCWKMAKILQSCTYCRFQTLQNVPDQFVCCILSIAHPFSSMLA
jgi:hypothetical protein